MWSRKGRCSICGHKSEGAERFGAAPPRTLRLSASSALNPAIKPAHASQDPYGGSAYSDPLSSSRSHRNFYWQPGIFAREYKIQPFAFSSLALVWNVRHKTRPGKGSRGPFGDSGLGRLPPPAIPAGSTFTYPSRTPAGCVCLPFASRPQRGAGVPPALFPVSSQRMLTFGPLRDNPRNLCRSRLNRPRKKARTLSSRAKSRAVLRFPRCMRARTQRGICFCGPPSDGSAFFQQPLEPRHRRKSQRASAPEIPSRSPRRACPRPDRAMAPEQRARTTKVACKKRIVLI